MGHARLGKHLLDAHRQQLTLAPCVDHGPLRQHLSRVAHGDGHRGCRGIEGKH